MRLDEYRPVFNTSLRFRHPVEIDEPRVLVFFDAVTKQASGFSEYRKAKGDFHLVEREEGDIRRQMMVNSDGVVIAVAPLLSLSSARETGCLLYPLVSQHLEPSPLLMQHLDVSLRFGFPYKGSHDALVLTELFGGSAYAETARLAGGSVRGFEPHLSLALTADHSMVALIEIKTQTTDREMQSGVFDGDEIRVECGVGKVKNLGQQSLLETFCAVFDQAADFVDRCLVEPLLEKLRAASTQRGA